MGAALNHALAFAPRSVGLAERKRSGVLKERVSAAQAISIAIGRAGVDPSGSCFLVVKQARATGTL